MNFDVSDATCAEYNWDLYFIYFADMRPSHIVNRASPVRHRLTNLAYFNDVCPANISTKERISTMKDERWFHESILNILSQL